MARARKKTESKSIFKLAVKAGGMRLGFCLFNLLGQQSRMRLTQGPVLSSWPFASVAAFASPSALSAENTRLLLKKKNYEQSRSSSASQLGAMIHSPFMQNIPKVRSSFLQAFKVVLEVVDYWAV